MADGSQNSLFSLLAARYGIGPALQLFGLITGQGSDFSKALGATQLAGSGAQSLGYLTGNPAIQSLGGYAPYLWGGLGGAGLGYNLYNTLSDPNLSAGQKAGTAALQTGEGAVSLAPAASAAVPALAPTLAPLAAAAPYVAALLATQAVGGAMEKSGSPQIRAGGRQVLAPILPIMGFENLITGKQSPRAAANATIEGMKQVPVLGKPLGKMLGLFGIGTKPTQGHMFRTELESIFGQLAPLKGLKAAQYQMPTGGYGGFDPNAVSAAEQLGKILAAYAPTGKAAPDQYALQTENILLNKYGNQMPQIMQQLLPLLRGENPAAAQAQAPAPAPGGLGPAASLGPSVSTMLKSILAGQKAA